MAAILSLTRLQASPYPAWVDLGLSPYGLAVADYAAVARAADQLGLESFWMPDHLVIPREVASAFPYSEDGNAGLRPDTPVFDAWAALAYIAAGTSRLRLGTYVYLLALRHPFVTAKAVATVDILSGGRALLGIGAGWLAEEFAAAAEPFPDRGRRTAEAVALLRRLWTEPLVESTGEHYAFPAVGMSPRPAAPIPILMGGHSGIALRRAAELADGWMASSAPPDALAEQFAALLPRVDAALAAAGRERDSFEVTAGVIGVPDAAARRSAATAGVDRLIVAPWAARGEPVSAAAAVAELEDLVATGVPG